MKVILMGHIRIGDKVLEVSGHRIINGQRVPVIKAEAKEIKHSDGRVDVVVKVPVLQIASKQEEV